MVLLYLLFGEKNPYLVPRIPFVFALDFKAKCRLGNMHRLDPALVRCPSGVTRGSPHCANLASCTIVL